MKGKALGELIGLVGIVGSLIFVGLEVRQNTLAARAAAYQDMGTAISEVWLLAAQDPRHATLTLRNFEYPAGDFSPAEEAQLLSQNVAALRQYEVVWRQVELGLLDEEVLEYFGWVPGEIAAQRNWERIRRFMSPDFREFLEEAARMR